MTTVLVAKGDDVYEGSKVEVIVKMRRDGYTMPTIAQALNCTTSYVSRIARLNGLGGRIDNKPTLEVIPDAELRNTPVEEVARVYRVPIDNVVKLKQLRNIRKVTRVSKKLRYIRLCAAVFGGAYLPGPEFGNLIKGTMTEHITDVNILNEMNRFYFDLEGGDDSNKKQLRKRARDVFKDVFGTVNKKYLIQNNFIRVN